MKVQGRDRMRRRNEVKECNDAEEKKNDENVGMK